MNVLNSNILSIITFLPLVGMALLFMALIIYPALNLN